MIAQLQINRVIEIIKDYTTFLSLLLVYIYLDVQSQNDISTILLWRGLNIRYMKLYKIMYQESYPYRVLFYSPKHTISCCNNYNHVFEQTKKEGLSWAIMFSHYGRNRRLMIFILPATE